MAGVGPSRALQGRAWCGCERETERERESGQTDHGEAAAGHSRRETPGGLWC